MIKRRHKDKRINIDVSKLIKSKKFTIGLVLLITLFLFFFYRKASLYVFFLGITAIIIYYTKLYHVPIDVSPLFFLEIVITKYYGFGFTLLYVLLAYIIPKTFAGSNMNMNSYIFISISMIANVFVMVFPTMPLIWVGFLTSIIQYIGGMIYQSTMMPVFFCAIDGLGNVANNLLWFLIFSDVIVWLFRGI